MADCPVHYLAHFVFVLVLLHLFPVLGGQLQMLLLLQMYVQALCRS